MVLEVADPVNYGRYLISTPLAPVTAKDVLQVYGLRDTYSPRETQVALAVSIGVAVAEPVLDDLGLPTMALPASGNRNAAGVPTTAVLSQHDPAAGADGHFVATQDDVARRRVAQFFATAARDGTPTVVP
jgi:hypothetical protein